MIVADHESAEELEDQGTWEVRVQVRGTCAGCEEDQLREALLDIRQVGQLTVIRREAVAVGEGDDARSWSALLTCHWTGSLRDRRGRLDELGAALSAHASWPIFDIYVLSTEWQELESARRSRRQRTRRAARRAGAPAAPMGPGVRPAGRARSRTITLEDGRQVGVRRHGPASGHPIVLLHGFLDDAGCWESVSDDLGRPTYCIELPGHGMSDFAPRADLDAWAEQILAACDQLGLERFSLAGHSLGGATARHIADVAPERVTGLALVTPAGFGTLPTAEAVDVPVVRSLAGVLLDRGLSLNVPGTRTFKREVMRHMVTGGERLSDRVVDRFSGAVQQRASRASAQGLRILAHLSRHHDLDALGPARYQGPVVGVWGTDDPLIPWHHRKAFQRVFPHGRLQEWNDLGHYPTEEDGTREPLAELLRRIP